MKDTRDDLSGKINRFTRLMHRARHQFRGEPAHSLGFDPHRGQGRILTLLNLQDGLCQRDIAYTLDIRPQSLGELLGKLEAGGYIRRESDELDRRTQLVYLTDEGREAAQDLNKPHGFDSARVFDILESSERAEFSLILDKLIDHLVDEVGDEPERAPFHPHGPFHPHDPLHPHGPFHPHDPGEDIHFPR